MDDTGRPGVVAHVDELLNDPLRKIMDHPRLLRSLDFGDDDYFGCVAEMVPLLLGEATRRSPSARRAARRGVSQMMGAGAGLTEQGEGTARYAGAGAFVRPGSAAPLRGRLHCFRCSLRCFLPCLAQVPAALL
ncbi:hypothetical protein [Actinacidiphila oryziradicis]|uniref:hypothetical protein n=1 Tax=Actinacidiphila oryziradicis TaxID=2571141 RepID=UPI003898DCA3